MKLLPKQRHTVGVCELWDEARQADMLSPAVYGARTDAAAEEGDVDGAAVTIDLKYDMTRTPGAICFGSAMNACKNSQNASYREALFFYEKMEEAGQTPEL